MDAEKPKEHPRRLSRRAPSNGASRWRLPSRKNSRQPEHDDEGGEMKKRDSDAESTRESDDGRPMNMLEKQGQQQQLQNMGTLGASTSSLTRGASTSLVPDPLPSYTDQLLQQIPGVLPPVRSHYPLHNPKGPKAYHNHHLIEPQTRMPISSTFSPSFPAMRPTANGAAVVMDSLRIPVAGPSRSRSNSNSPVATPNASQTRLADGLAQQAPGTRSRKVSQTAHDNVDMLDASDPWGQNWHHHSPYDVGLNNVPSQTPAQDVRPLLFLSLTLIFIQIHLLYIAPDTIEWQPHIKHDETKRPPRKSLPTLQVNIRSQPSRAGCDRSPATHSKLERRNIRRDQAVYVEHIRRTQCQWA